MNCKPSLICIFIGITTLLVFLGIRNKYKSYVNRYGTTSPTEASTIPPSAAILIMVQQYRIELTVSILHDLKKNFLRDHAQYPIIFFHDNSLRRSDKKKLVAAVSSTIKTSFVQIDLKLPTFQRKPIRTVSRYTSISYRSVMRFYGGLFALHPSLSSYDYYLRIDSDIRIHSPIEDPFLIMQSQSLLYGCTPQMDEFDSTGYSDNLWPSIVKEYAPLIGLNISSINVSLWWRQCGNNQCFRVCNSMIELGDLKFFRGEKYQHYFRWIDATKHGFYEDVFNNPKGDFKLGDHIVKATGLALFGRYDQWKNFDFGNFTHH